MRAWLLALILCVPAASASARCLDEKAVAQLTADLNLPFRGDGYSLCMPSSKEFKLFEALLFLREHKAPAAKKGESDIVGQDFWAYFRGRIGKMVYEGGEHYCAESNLMAYVMEGTVHVCGTFFDADRSLLSRVVALMHEVRHLDGDGHAHAVCARGPYQGRKGCDDNLASQGAYAVSLEVATKISRMENVDQEMRLEAAEKALDVAESNFSQSPFARHEAVYLADEAAQRAYFFDGVSTYPAPYLAGARVVGRSENLSVFPAGKGDAFTLDVFSARPVKLGASGRIAQAYNQLAAEDRPGYLDLLIRPGFACVMEASSLTCFSAWQEGVSVSVPEGLRAVYFADEMGERGERVFYLLTAGGGTKRMELIGNAPWYRLEEAPGVKPAGEACAVMSESLYCLRGGRLFVREGGGWRDALPGARFSSMSRPFAWAAELYRP